jgi:hypothetical protein
VSSWQSWIGEYPFAIERLGWRAVRVERYKARGRGWTVYLWLKPSVLWKPRNWHMNHRSWMLGPLEIFWR